MKFSFLVPSWHRRSDHTGDGHEGGHRGADEPARGPPAEVLAHRPLLLPHRAERGRGGGGCGRGQERCPAGRETNSRMKNYFMRITTFVMFTHHIYLQRIAICRSLAPFLPVRRSRTCSSTRTGRRWRSTSRRTSPTTSRSSSGCSPSSGRRDSHRSARLRVDMLLVAVGAWAQVKAYVFMYH